IIAAAIFVVMSVALSGVWIMYSRALGKSGEVISANHLARSVVEGLTANGWDWLETQQGITPLPEEDYVVERIVRGKPADIKFKVTYEVFVNGNTGQISPLFSPDICRLIVTVRW